MYALLKSHIKSTAPRFSVINASSKNSNELIDGSIQIETEPDKIMFIQRTNKNVDFFNTIEDTHYERDDESMELKMNINIIIINGYNFYYYSNVQRSQYRGCVLHVVKRLLHDSSLKEFNREISTANCLVCLMCGNEYVNNNNNNNNNKTHPIHINPLNMMDIKNRCCMDKNNANIVEFFMN